MADGMFHGIGCDISIGDAGYVSHLECHTEEIHVLCSYRQMTWNCSLAIQKYITY